MSRSLACSMRRDVGADARGIAFGFRLLVLKRFACFTRVTITKVLALLALLDLKYVAVVACEQHAACGAVWVRMRGAAMQCFTSTNGLALLTLVVLKYLRY